MSSNDNHHWGGRYPPPSRGRGYRRGGGQFHRQPQGGHRPPGRDAPPPYHPHGNTNQHQPRQQSHHNQNRFNPHEGGVRDHHHYDHKRQKTGHSSSGNNNNNSSSSDYYGGNNATHRLRQDNTPGPSIPQAQSEAVEIPQNSLGSTRNEAEPTSASTNPETTTTTATRTDLTHATTTCGDENSVPLIDTKDEYLPFRKDSTGYWNDPTILQEKLVAALPSDAQALRKLPPHKYEPDFKERLQRSYTTVMRRLLAEVAKRPPASGGYSSSSDYDSDDDYDRVDMRAPPTDPVLAQRKLLKEVAENPAVHFGFQCYSAKEFDMWCCCPMGQKLQKERYTGCGSHSRMRPRDFVAHLISEHSGKGPLNDHKVVYQFLECLYSKVYQDRNNIRYDHEAITNDMKQRNGFWRVRNAEEYSLLLSGIEQENALMESFQALKLQLDESANQIDEDFHARRKLDAMKKALENERKEKLMKKAFIELLPEVTMIDKERFLNFYNRRVQVFERYLDSKFDDAIFNVILPDSFDVRESFKSWSYKCEEHGSNFNHRCTHCYMNTMLTIDDTNKYFNFELTYTIGFRVEIDGVKLGKIEGAEVFLSEVWKQLRNLYFEWNGNCYEPLEDERLANKKNKTKWMYHAIGRLISFSLLHGIKPPRKILPPSLWVHLFRGTDYLETDNCFQSFAFDMRANEESNVQELCTEYGVARLGEDEHFDSFLKRIYPVVLDHAKTQERDYRSARQLSWAALKEGFEYSQIPFDSKQKFTNNLQERLSLCVRQSVASDPWTAAASILAEECTEEESVEYLDL